MKQKNESSSPEFTDSNLVPSNGVNPQSDATRCISSVGDTPGSIEECDVNHVHLPIAQGVPYLVYNYPGYGGFLGDFDNQVCFNGYNYVGADALVLQNPVMQGDNESCVYFVLGFQTDYSPYFPQSTIGVDGQYVSNHMYPPDFIFQQPVGARRYYSAPLPNGELQPSPGDSSLTTQDGSHVYGSYELAGNPSGGPNLTSQSHTVRIVSKSTSPPNLRNPSEVKSSTKLKPRNEVNCLLNEQNQGPRTANAKGALKCGGNSAETFVKDGSRNGTSKNSLMRMDQYNLPDFPTNYDNAFFFVIKSNSEVNIHKSIKYNVWSSTPNGNKRLDGAYQDSKKWMAAKGSNCPVFLFFSVNSSGKFCGVAEIIGRVDFNKNMDFWQQDKWNGYFPVKWHMVKDVPNYQLRHIILENNGNKPVTNSRDTQEVSFLQGVQMLNIFKNYGARTSLLDYFELYESREKASQEKKVRQPMPHSNMQDVEELSITFGSIDISTMKNNEDSKLDLL